MEGVSGKGRQRCVCVGLWEESVVRVHECICGCVCFSYHNMHATTFELHAH